MADDQELQIKITTSADTSGTEAATSGLRDVASAAGEAQKGGEGLGKGLGESRQTLREFSRSGFEVREAIEGIGKASQGGVGAVTGLAHAFRALLGILRGAVGAAGPIGLIALALGALVGLFMALGKHTEEAGDKMKGAGKDADDYGKKLEGLEKTAKKAFEEQLKELQKLHEAYRQNISDIENAIKRGDELRQADQKHALEFEELKKNEALKKAKTPEEAQKIENTFAKKQIELRAEQEKENLGMKEVEANLKIAEAKKHQEDIGKQIQQAEDKKAQAEAARQQAVGTAKTATENELELRRRGGATAEDLAPAGRAAREKARAQTESSSEEVKRQDDILSKLKGELKETMKVEADAQVQKKTAHIEAETVTVHAENELDKQDQKESNDAGKDASKAAKASKPAEAPGSAPAETTIQQDMEAAFGRGLSDSTKSKGKAHAAAKALSDMTAAQGEHHEAIKGAAQAHTKQLKAHAAEIRNTTEAS